MQPHNHKAANLAYRIRRYGIGAIIIAIVMYALAAWSDQASSVQAFTWALGAVGIIGLLGAEVAIGYLRSGSD